VETEGDTHFVVFDTGARVSFKTTTAVENTNARLAGQTSKLYYTIGQLWHLAEFYKKGANAGVLAVEATKWKLTPVHFTVREPIFNYITGKVSTCVYLDASFEPEVVAAPGVTRLGRMYP
jgi:hypothetical protein